MPGDLTPNARGALYMTLGSLAAVINDGLVRVAVEEGVDVYQALFLRGGGMVVVLAAAGRARRQRLDRRGLTPPLGLRVGAEVVVAGAFFTALAHLPFANAHTILLTAPFAVTVVAARLGERVSHRRYVLVGIGFAGVIAVVRPTPGEFSPWSLLVVLAAAALVVREFATRRISQTTPPLPIALLTAAAITVMMGGVSVVTGWGPVTTRAAIALAGAGSLLVVGYLFVIEAVRVGELSVSAPFRYTTVVGAVAVGLGFFGEVPDPLTIIGCSLIVAAGAITARTDAAIQRRNAAPRTYGCDVSIPSPEVVWPARDADERTMLEGFLEAHRALVVRKAAGLDRRQLSMSLGRSSVTLGGLLKHLAAVEDDWFHSDLAGNGFPEPWASVDETEGHDWPWTSAADDSPEELLELFEAACARSRIACSAAASLDVMSVKTDQQGNGWPLRWIYVHMIEEYARHVGHADLIRESIDGTTGD